MDGDDRSSSPDQWWPLKNKVWWSALLDIYILVKIYLPRLLFNLIWDSSQGHSLATAFGCWRGLGWDVCIFLMNSPGWRWWWSHAIALWINNPLVALASSHLPRIGQKWSSFPRILYRVMVVALEVFCGWGTKGPLRIAHVIIEYLCRIPRVINQKAHGQ